MTMITTPDRRKKILIISASVGAGHNSVAQALTTELHAGGAPVDVETIDALDFASPLFRLSYSGGFRLGMTRLQPVYGLGFDLWDQPHTPERACFEKTRIAIEKACLRRLGAYLDQTRPDLIVHVHFLAGPYVARQILREHAPWRHMVVVTDQYAHRWWYCEHAERYFLPSEYTRERPEQWGIADDRITVTGIPVHPKWNRPLDRRRVLAEWNLPDDKDIILFSGGTEFTCAPVPVIARGLLDACPNAHLVVMAGRNKKVLAQLSQMPEARGRMTPVAFTDRAHELGEVCSLMITKSGGVTTAECLCKGIPMLFTRPVPGQETPNAHYFERMGAAKICPAAGDIIETTRRLLAEPRERAAMAEAARGLYRPARETISRMILDSLGL